jgi:hypothetical protein
VAVKKRLGGYEKAARWLNPAVAQPRGGGSNLRRLLKCGTAAPAAQMWNNSASDATAALNQRHKQLRIIIYYIRMYYFWQRN